MSKYDEFGRPIYETAEEYNRAHGTGSYHNAERKSTSYTEKKTTYRKQRTIGQNEKRSVSPKVIVLAIGALVYLVVMAVTLMSNIVRDNDSIENWANVEEEAVAVREEYLGDTVTPLPDGFETFSYKGQTYALPTTMADILKMGFTLEEAYDENYMLPPQYEETVILNGENGYMVAMVGMSNYTDDEIPLEDATIHYFYIDTATIYDMTDFVFGDGFTFESSYEDLETYFGIPYYHYEDYTEDYAYDNYEWAYYGEEETHIVNISFWNGMISDIGIEKRILVR